jgi:hypothetical protein
VLLTSIRNWLRFFGVSNRGDCFCHAAPANGLATADPLASFRWHEPVSRIHHCSKCRSAKVHEGIGCTNLPTTTKYLQTVRERMKDAVSGFGAEISEAKILDTNLDTSQKGQGRYKPFQNGITGFSPKLLCYEVNGGSTVESD